MITFCISTYNNLEYLKIAINSVRKNSYYNNAPFIIHAENCTDGTDEWLKENSNKYDLEYYIDKNDIPLGIGGGMNFCADRVKTEYIMFLHSDFYVTKDWDKSLMDIFDKYPNKKMWVNSHRVEPNMFNNPESRPGTVIVPKDAFGAYYDDFKSDDYILCTGDPAVIGLSTAIASDVTQGVSDAGSMITVWPQSTEEILLG